MLARKAPGVAQGFEQQLAEVAKTLSRKVRGLGPQAAEPGEAVQQQIAIAHLPGRNRIAEVAPEVGIAVDGRAKIQQHQLIAGVAAADQIIAEVGVRLQHPPLVQLQEKQLQHRLAEGVAARLGKPRHFGLGDPITADVLQRQHGIGAVVLGHPGHIVGAARRTGGEALVRGAGHRQFAGVIDLAVQLAAHLFHPGVHIAAGFDPAGEQQQAHNGVEVVIDQRGETGILHLEHEIAVAALTARTMHLGQRSRRQRLRIDAQVPVARPEALAHCRLQLGPGQRLRLRIEIVQGFGERRGQKVLTEQREHLPDLHVAAFKAPQFRRKAPRFTAHQFIAFAAAAQPVQRRTQGQRAPGAQPRHGNRQPAANAAASYCRVFTHALHTRRLGIRIQGVSGSVPGPAPPNCPRQWLTRIQALWIS